MIYSNKPVDPGSQRASTQQQVNEHSESSREREREREREKEEGEGERERRRNRREALDDGGDEGGVEVELEMVAGEHGRGVQRLEHASRDSEVVV